MLKRIMFAALLAMAAVPAFAGPSPEERKLARESQAAGTSQVTESKTKDSHLRTAAPCACPRG